MLNDLTGKLTGNSLVNFPVKVNRKSELTGIDLKVSCTGEHTASMGQPSAAVVSLKVFYILC